MVQSQHPYMMYDKKTYTGFVVYIPLMWIQLGIPSFTLRSFPWCISNMTYLDVADCFDKYTYTSERLFFIAGKCLTFLTR